MRAYTGFSIAKESLEDQLEAQRYNPGLEITFRDRKGAHKHKISAGYAEEIHVYRESTLTYVLSHNPGLGYVGLEVFEGQQKLDEVFLQGEQMFDVLGDDELTPWQMIRQLENII